MKIHGVRRSGMRLPLIIKVLCAVVFINQTMHIIQAIERLSDPTVLIVTVNSGEGSEEYWEALGNQALYAKCHGYGFLNAAVTEVGDKSVHPFMLKAFALKNIFLDKKYSSYDYVLWIDRDAIFMDHRISISERLKQLNTWTFREGASAVANPDVFTYDLVIAVESWAWLNSGVLLFRNTQYSRMLVDKWISTYIQREYNYKSNEIIHISGVPKTFRDLFKPKWSCEDQGALIALLAGYDGSTKWNTDRYDGLGVPHVLHEGHAQWASLSTSLILDPKYQKVVKIVAQEWFNTNPWDQEKYEKEQGPKHIEPFIFHFNGQNNKPALIKENNKLVKHCESSFFFTPS